jgi:hypothetical protein
MGNPVLLMNLLVWGMICNHLSVRLRLHSCISSGVVYGTWIRTHNPSGRAAANLPLRPRGHWDRHKLYSSNKKKLYRGLIFRRVIESVLLLKEYSCRNQKYIFIIEKVRNFIL